ncbi:hypothetical protein R3P38DRAFT_2806574 [Favolaschia claudopus]|uniref:Uncharacterized protein n=1 Tax=Favolaschia claudopus TaxID=2862362 RepID=A0AAV9ZJK4_9AGAR
MAYVCGESQEIKIREKCKKIEEDSRINPSASQLLGEVVRKAHLSPYAAIAQNALRPSANENQTFIGILANANGADRYRKTSDVLHVGFTLSRVYIESTSRHPPAAFQTLDHFCIGYDAAAVLNCRESFRVQTRRSSFGFLLPRLTSRGVAGHRARDGPLVSAGGLISKGVVTSLIHGQVPHFELGLERQERVLWVLGGVGHAESSPKMEIDAIISVPPGAELFSGLRRYALLAGNQLGGCQIVWVSAEYGVWQ